MSKLKIHLFTLPRWFAAPFFGSSLMMGVILAGGDLTTIYPWVGLIAGLLIMAGGHPYNRVCFDYQQHGGWFGHHAWRRHVSLL